MIHLHREKQRAMEAAMRRRMGLSPEHAERLTEHNEGCEDWRGECPLCGAKLHGTLAALRTHQCPRDAA